MPIIERELTIQKRRRRAAAIVSTLGLLFAAAACGDGDAERSPSGVTGAISGGTSAPTTIDAPDTVAPSTMVTSDVPTIAPPATEPVAAPEITAADVLERNPLYAAAPLLDVGCGAIASTPLDTVDNVRAFYSSMMPCLDAAWAQIGAGTGIAVRPANLVVFTGPSASSCLDGVTYSFYCGNDETIHMYADEMIQPWLEFPTEYSHGITKLAAVHTLAHEYGHHVQTFTGILGVLGSDFYGTEAERRLELQASCLANVFLASQASAYPIAPDYLDEQNLWRFITRVPNHGSEANQALWTAAGYQSAAPGQCNAFSAPAEQVA